jgi:glycosyltransferase involved in cell wall biosynthesis
MTNTNNRVLIISHGHPQLSPGGGEIVAYKLYQAIQTSGLAEAYYLGAMLPQFGLPHCGSALLPANVDPNQTLYWSDRYNYFLMAQDNLGVLLEEFGRYLEEVRPAAVHFHHVHNLGVEMIRMVRNICPDARILMTLHEFLPICHHNGQMVKTKTLVPCWRSSSSECNRCFPEIQSGEFFFRERFLKSHLKLVDLFLCPSQFLLSRYIDWGIPKEKLIYVENGHVAGDHSAPPVPPPGRNAFAFFGQISPYKGLPILFDAAKRLISRGFGSFNIDVFGSMLFLSGDQESAIRKRFAEIESHVQVHGAYRYQDVIALMSTVDWVIVPSIWWENSPLVIQEAFAARRPVICSNIGGMAEKVRHETDGLHFRVGDPISLADTMTRACTEPGLHERLSAGIAPVHPMRTSAREHLALYGILDKPTTRRPAGVPASSGRRRRPAVSEPGCATIAIGG